MTAGAQGQRGRWIGLTRALMALALMVSILTAVVPQTTVVEAAIGGQSSKYVSISPIRVLDTRDPGFTKMRSGDTLSVDPLTDAVLQAAGNVDPLDVVAVAVNLTITEPISDSWLRSLPTGLVTPAEMSTSAVNNRDANETIANLSIVPVGANGRISIYTLRSSHAIVDVQGLFTRASSSKDGRFVPLAVPTRVTDTRTTNQPLAAGTSRVIDLTTVGIPATASAALINLVATETTGTGYLTAYPGGTPPYVSNLNYPGGGHTVAGSAITRLDNGKLTIYANGGTHLVVDVIGYMTGASDADSKSGLFVSIPPERHYDSRSNELPYGTTALAANTARAVQIAGQKNVPATGVLGVATNLTMTNTDGAGYLVMYSKNPMPQKYSTVNSVIANQSIANHAITALDGGKLRVFSIRRADFIVDVTGYFLDGTTTPPSTPRPAATNPAPMPDVNPGVVPTPGSATPGAPPIDEDYDYLIEARGSNASYGAYERGGRRYFGWKPCEPITYAVNTQRATQVQIDAMNAAIRHAEDASGIDFQYVGEVTGSLSTDNVDPRVPGGTNAMAVIGFSDPYATPILDGGTIGIGGIGPSVLGQPVTQATPTSTGWITKGGFALIDITDIIEPDEIESAFTHEIGHMLGLDHVFNAPGELMQPVISNPPQTTYGNGDKNGLFSIGEPQCPGGAPLLAADARSAAPTEIAVTHFVAD